MISRAVSFLVFNILVCSYSSLAVAACKELAVAGTGEEDQFYVACTNSLLKPAYIVTQYYGGTEHFGVLTLNVGSTGYFCSGDSAQSSCNALPKGAIPYGTYKSRKSKVTVADIGDSEVAYKYKDAIFRFPKSHSAATSIGCFVVIQKERDVVIGLSKNKLYQSAQCLVSLERYIASDKKMLFR